jgi:hypothetical protein
MPDEIRQGWVDPVTDTDTESEIAKNQRLAFETIKAVRETHRRLYGKCICQVCK